MDPTVFGAAGLGLFCGSIVLAGAATWEAVAASPNEHRERLIMRAAMAVFAIGAAVVAFAASWAALS